MSTKYTKVVAIIKGKMEVFYITDSEMERCRNRVGKEGCEDTSMGNMSTVEDVWKVRRTEGNAKRKVIML